MRIGFVLHPTRPRKDPTIITVKEKIEREVRKGSNDSVYLFFQMRIYRNGLNGWMYMETES
jgi:hypothetical protein